MNISRFPVRGLVAVAAVALLGATLAGVRAQAPAKLDSSAGNPPSGSSANKWTPSAVPANSKTDFSPRPAPACCGYPFPRSTDAEIADGDAHRVLFEDSHVMFLEVINPPLYDIHMHGHPFASVFAHDSNVGPKNPDAPPTSPNGADGKLDANSPFNDMGSGNGAAPAGMMWPTCTDSGPQAPHRPFNGNMAPNHFYRLEFLRLDGMQGYAENWKQWYPEVTQPEKTVKEIVAGPALGPKFSEQWPYPIAYDSIQAAPNNYRLLYEDGKMRLLEVMIRPGETTPMHGSPYPSVLAFNTLNTLQPGAKDVSDKFMDPASPLNGQGSGVGKAPSVDNLTVPLCMTQTPRAPHAIHNGGTLPLHYYQIEYKRIDGPDLLTKWKEWYPFMMYMQYTR